MTFQWSIILDLGVLSLALLLATLIRAKVRFFQRFLIPNALTAGFIALIFYNVAAPDLGMNTNGLGNLVFHLLSISFIAMSLRRTGKKKNGKMVFATGISLMLQYGIQTVLGFAISMVLFFTIMPQIFPGFGVLLTAGFSLGPGQAYAIGTGWEKFGFSGGGTIGLTFGAIGYLWACFVGMTIINIAIRKGWLKVDEKGLVIPVDIQRGVHAPNDGAVEESLRTTEPEAIDPMTYNFGIVLATYLLTYLFMHGISWLLSFAGPTGEDLAWNLWGITFVFAALIAQLVKKLMSIMKVDYTLDAVRLTRISGLSVDLMVAAALGAISLVVVGQFWLPILIITMAGGVVTTFSHLWLSSRIFSDYVFHRVILVYGAVTGTLPTGLALLRVIDPEFETPAAPEYMYATGIAFLLAIPLILAMNLPSYGFANNNPAYYWIAMGVFSAFLISMFILYVIIARKRAFAKPFKLWLGEEE